MASTEYSIFINRPPKDVWDIYSDPAKFSQWTTSSAEWTSQGPPGVGSTLREVSKFMGRKLESTAEITVWDPPKEHSRKLTSGPLPFEITIKFEPKDSGTQVNVHISGEVSGLLKVMMRIFIKPMEKQMDTNFQKLKHLLEGGQG